MSEQQWADLDRRLRQVEDELAVLRVVASYGPLVDVGDPGPVAALWDEDGVYDVDTGTYTGHDGIAAMVASAPHQALLARGCAHLLAAPHVSVDGDAAVAVGHSQLVVSGERGYRVVRVTAHRWELVRGADGTWRVVRRTSRLLDGSAEARALLQLSALPGTAGG